MIRAGSFHSVPFCSVLVSAVILGSFPCSSSAHWKSSLSCKHAQWKSNSERALRFQGAPCVVWPVPKPLMCLCFHVNKKRASTKSVFGGLWMPFLLLFWPQNNLISVRDFTFVRGMLPSCEEFHLRARRFNFVSESRHRGLWSILLVCSFAHTHKLS